MKMKDEAAKFKLAMDTEAGRVRFTVFGATPTGPVPLVEGAWAPTRAQAFQSLAEVLGEMNRQAALITKAVQDDMVAFLDESWNERS